MANSTHITIKGNNLITWGSKDVGTTFGIVTAGGRKHTGDIAEIKDEDGNVIATIYFNEKDECEVTAIYQTSITLPERGDSITICGVLTALVAEWEFKWESGKEMMYTLRATKYKWLVLGS